MIPRLVVLTGTTQSNTIPLSLADGETFDIGRDLANALSIADASASRRHCLLKFSGGDFVIEDLASHNGTLVNDAPVQTQTLKHGDRIQVGKARLLFLTEENENFPPTQAELDNGLLITKTDIRLLPDEFAAKVPSDLDVLVKFGKILNEEKDPAKLRERFLEIILEIVPAERGAILLFDEDESEPSAVFVMTQDRRLDLPKMTVSRTVTELILREKVALLSNNLTTHHLNAAESLIASQVKSLLCVPIKNGTLHGLIYLDSFNVDFDFTETHLQQMTAISFLISAALDNAHSLQDLQSENARLQANLGIETDIIGESQPVREIFQKISKIAPTEATVLISGESGTGKELAARAIHRNSLRREKPFVAINCAVLNENLLESELFGHEKGAFTGAFAPKKGKLELAEGGTLFLDEIGELAPTIQAKLLRVLQEREFERVGGVKTLKANVRLIAATNQNLTDEVKKGAFREDLFFRLNVVPIKMPPLRERQSDIPLLAQHFIRKHSERCKRKVEGLSKKAREILLAYDWRGNVRELENAIERAIVLGSTETILPDDLPEEIVESTITEHSSTATGTDFHEQIKKAKQKIILDALEKTGENYSEAARQLGVHPNNLHRLIRSLGIKKSS